MFASRRVRSLVLSICSLVPLVSSPAVAQQCVTPSGTAVGWWMGDGTTADSRGGRSATLHNGAGYADGMVSQAFSFDGVDDFASVAHDAALDFGSGDWGIHFWVWFDDLSGDQVLMEKYVASASPTGWSLLKTASQQFRFVWPGGQFQSGPQGLQANTWYHVTFGRSGGTTAGVRINGTAVTGSTSFSGDLSSSASVKFGHRGSPTDTPGSLDSSGLYLKGRVDEVVYRFGAGGDGDYQAAISAGEYGICSPNPACNNGRPEPGESCDDGNLVDGDGCESDCTLSCGNGAVTGTEECDDGNAVEGDGCDNNCTLTGCGNAALTGAEQCDDGNLTDGDGCDSNCTPTGCGNAVLTGAEQCDDGNLTSGDGCDSNCTPTGCGNGVATPGEECDDGNGVESDACRNSCVAAVCGDGILRTGVEECDDANAVPADGCEPDCTATPGACAPTPSGITGWWVADGIADDAWSGRDATLRGGVTYASGRVGQAFDLDGVDDFVSVADAPELNPGTGDFAISFWVRFDSTAGEQVLAEKWVESGEASGWTVTKREWNEIQFAIARGGDAASGVISIPTHTWIHFAARRSSGSLAVFMNGTQIASGATSHDANTTSSLKFGHRGDPIDTPGSEDTRGFYLDGRIDEVLYFVGTAPSDSEIQAIHAAGSGGVCLPAPVCGNGRAELGEPCDDGNLVDGDGCETDCSLSCGNGLVTGSEQCDDGNTVEGDGCDSNCTATGCGNGVVSGAEQCDDGNAVEGDGCDNNCTLTGCGNAALTGAEQCDDGNLTDGDGCDSNCTPTGCGNVVLTGAEQCDDGNLTSGDGCDSNCTPTGCGNGVATPGEECDDGNATEGDGCDSNCTTPACGNSIVAGGEGCDDGNTTDNDGCDRNCQPTGCGNGVRTEGEVCDDGNLADGDGCDDTCTVSAGILDPTFDTDGIAVGPEIYDSFGPVVVDLQTDGRILVAYTAHGSPARFAVTRYASDGSLDATFGTAGVVATAVGADDAILTAMAVQPDGRIVAAGFSSDSGRRITLVRYLANGTLDPSFGVGGVVVTTMGPPGREAHALAITPGGAIVVAGGDENERLLIARYNSSGVLDPAFGGTGIVVDPRVTVGTAVAVQSDGRIVTATGGYWDAGDIVVSRFLADGHIDDDFGTDGMRVVTTGTENRSALTLQSDGKIVVAGQARGESAPFGWGPMAFVTLRLNTDGSLDNTYDGDGISILDPTTGDENLGGVVVGPDAKITVSGYSEFGYQDVTLARFRPDGTPDPGFAGKGWLSVSYAGGSVGHNLVLQPDGKVVVGAAGDFFQSNLVVLRFLAGTCGDFRAQTDSGEHCDDGNPVDGDGCESDCTLTPIVETVAAGGSVTTDPLGQGATESAPLQTSLTTPNGGTVSIATAPEAPAPVEGLEIVGVQLQIEAPPATPEVPLSIALTVDASALPAGTDPIQLEVLRDGEPIAACTGAAGTASPDPCVQSRSVLAGGDVQLVVLTSHASLWSLAIRGLFDGEQDCVNAVGKTANVVAKVQGKLAAACLKAAAKNTTPDADACLLADVGGKLQAAMGKVDGAASNLCLPPPPFGFGGATPAAEGARDAALGLLHDLIGNDVESGAATDDDGAKCQATVFKAMQKLFETEAKLVLACAKKGLADGESVMVSAPDLAACIASLVADPSGKVTKARAKIASGVASKCPGDPSTRLPGYCAGAGDIGPCLGQRATCRICGAFDAAWGLGADCDGADNGVFDGSCD